MAASTTSARSNLVPARAAAAVDLEQRINRYHDRMRASGTYEETLRAMTDDELLETAREMVAIHGDIWFELEGHAGGQ